MSLKTTSNVVRGTLEAILFIEMKNTFLIKLRVFTYVTALIILSSSVLCGQSPPWQSVKDSSNNYYEIKAAFLREHGVTLERIKREVANGVASPEHQLATFGHELETINQFMRWSEWVEPRVAESGGQLSTLAEGNVRGLAQQSRTTQSRTAAWQFLGPTRTPTSNIQQSGNGRVNAIRVHPTNPNILFACTPAGGLWKSVNLGGTWFPISDEIVVLGATDLAFSPVNPDTLYLATGDGEASDTRSTGIYKSTNGGNSWSTTGLTFALSQGITLSKILVHPTQPQILLTCGNSGIFRSTNGGNTWTTVTSGSFKDLEWQPNNPNVVYAGGYGASAGVWRSSDGGNTWTLLNVNTTRLVQRVSIAVTPHDSLYVYALCSTNTDHSLEGVYRSTDGGNSWTQQAWMPNLLGWEPNWASRYNGKGWYNLSLAVSPTDKNTVMVGGINIWKSVNGGVSWTRKSHWTGSGSPYVHGGQHDFIFTNGSTFYAAHDGGVTKSTDGGDSWTDISSTLGNAQIYSLGLSASNPNLMISSHQENGTNLTSDGTSWSKVLEGDGAQCFIDKNDNTRLFASNLYGALYRSTDSGNSWVQLFGIRSSFVTPWLQDPNNSSMAYLAGDHVYKTSKDGLYWGIINFNTQLQPFVSLDVYRPNSSIILACTNQFVYKTINGGDSWTTLTGLPTSGILKVHFNFNDSSKIYVGVASYQGNSVWYSSDGGSTWTNWGAGLPSVPVNCFASPLGTDGSVYCGTDLGVYYRNNSMTTWTAFTSGMPGVPVRDLKIYHPTQKIRAATFGRGIWESNLETPVHGFNIVAMSNAVRGGSVNGGGFYASGQTVTLTAIPIPNFIDSYVGNTNLDWNFVNWTENGIPISTNPTISFTVNANRTLVAHFAEGMCGTMTLTDCSGTITDGSGGAVYRNASYCNWLIRPTTPPTHLTLTFTQFDAGPLSDSVVVYDGTSTSGRWIGSYSGWNLPPRLVAMSGAMFIVFKTQLNSATQRWSANYACENLPTYRISLLPNPAGSCQTTGSGFYLLGDSINVTAVDNAGFVFNSWTDSLTNTIVSSSRTYGFRVNGNRTLLAKFAPIGCGAQTFTTCYGTITSGNGTSDYANNLNCTWLIQPATPSNSVELKFTTFATEARYDSVKIYDGTSSSGRLLGGYSGRDLPPRLFARSGSLFVTFTSDATVTFLGWSAIYRCGTEGLVRLRSNPAAATATLSGAGSYLIGDSVTISSATNIDRNCIFLNWTDSLTGAIVSTLPTYGFRITDNRTFIANYTLTGCNGLTTFTNCSGTFTDGSGANHYNNNSTCSWLIQPSTPNNYIALRFTQFSVESVNDYVKIYDGTSATGRLIGTYSGETLPSVVLATSGAMFITFTTNAVGTAAGWSAIYQCGTETTYYVRLQINPATMRFTTVSGEGFYRTGDSATISSTSDNWQYVFLNWTDSLTGAIVSTLPTYRFRATSNRSLIANYIIHGCSGLTTFTNHSGTVTDGSSIHYYRSGLNCNWLIQPSAPSPYISLRFTEFATTLTYDSVSIYDGTSTAGRRIGTYSGLNLPPTAWATSGAMFINFTTTSGTTNTGWSANYYASSGTQYQVRLRSTPAAAMATFSGEESYLLGDSAIVYSGASALNYMFLNWTDSLTGAIVSTLPTFGFRVTGNRTLIANYVTTGCDGLTTLTNCGGTITDGSSINNYNNNSNCSWLIQPPLTNSPILLSFTEFSVELAFDYLMIYDGTSAAGRLIGIYTGMNLPPAALATSGAMFITFKTDAGRTQSGWAATYSCVNSLLSVNVSSNAVERGSVRGGGGYAAGTTVTVIATPTTGNNFLNWTENGNVVSTTNSYTFTVSHARNLIANFGSTRTTIVDTVMLRAGWNLVGIYVNPLDTVVSSMLSPIVNELILMKALDGRIYFPSLGINTIQNWNTKEGYRLKVSQDVSVMLRGYAIDPTLHPIPFETGWNLVPYVRQNPMLFSNVFGTFASQIELAKDNLGQTWIPSANFNAIGNAQVNQAYRIKFNSSGTLLQPMNRRDDPPVDHLTTARYFELPQRSTGEDATIILLESALKDVLQVGDELGVFNSQGLLAGSVVWRGRNTAIAVKGDDKWTPSKDGLELGDNYQLYVKRLGVSEPMRLTVTFATAAQAQYSSDNVSWIEQARLLDIPVATAHETLLVYPNPVQNLLTLQLESATSAVTVVLYDMVGRVLQVPSESRWMGNWHIWQFDTSNLPNGVYRYQVSTAAKNHQGSYVVQH